MPSCYVIALQELGSLTGMRYYYSTALEAFDFLAPLLERLFSRIGDAGDSMTTTSPSLMGLHYQNAFLLICGCSSVHGPASCSRFALSRHCAYDANLYPDIAVHGCAVSWLLVRLIGRSLGLIYRGVRESLVPRQRPPGAKRGNQPRWAPL